MLKLWKQKDAPPPYGEDHYNDAGPSGGWNRSDMEDGVRGEWSYPRDKQPYEDPRSFDEEPVYEGGRVFDEGPSYEERHDTSSRSGEAPT